MILTSIHPRAEPTRKVIRTLTGTNHLYLKQTHQKHREMLKTKENVKCILRKGQVQEWTYKENMPVAALELMRPLAQSAGKKT